MTASTALTGAILLRIGDHEAHELTTFDVPLISMMTYDQATTTVEIGDWRRELITALRETADLIESGDVDALDQDRDDAGQ